MIDKVFLDDQEFQTVQALWQAVQTKQTEAALAQVGLNAYMQTLATARGLDPTADYNVSNRGELIARERPPRPTSPTEPAPSIEGQPLVEGEPSPPQVVEPPPQVTVEPSPTGQKLNRAQARKLQKEQAKK